MYRWGNDSYRYIIIVLETLDHLHVALKYPNAIITKRPFDYDYLQHLILKMKVKFQHEITLKFRNHKIKVDCSQIIYISSNKRICDFYGKDGLIASCYYKLDDLESILPHGFIRVHQSFMINLEYYDKCIRSDIRMKYVNNTIPISRSHYSKVKEQLNC